MSAKESELISKLNSAIALIRSKTQFVPQVGIILGTGLGELSKEIDIQYELNYTDIPYFVKSTVEFHLGKLLFGTLSNTNVVAMQGRFHYYEGYSMEEITLPIRVMKLLGANHLIISNACGSVNPYYRKGSLVILDDYINLLGISPLRGYNNEEFGTRFIDMSEPYSKQLITKVEEIASRNNIVAHRGIYAAMQGPQLETRAEYRFLRTIGADVVGMSTVPETIVARQMDMQVLGLSIVTDECYPDALNKVSLSDILAVAKKAEPDMALIIKELINQIDN